MFTIEQLNFIKNTVNAVNYSVKGHELSKVAATLAAINTEIDTQLNQPKE